MLCIYCWYYSMPIWKFKQCEEEWKKKQSQQHCFYSFSLSLSCVVCVFYSLCVRSHPVSAFKMRATKHAKKNRHTNRTTHRRCWIHSDELNLSFDCLHFKRNHLHFDICQWTFAKSEFSRSYEMNTNNSNLWIDQDRTSIVDQYQVILFRISVFLRQVLFRNSNLKRWLKTFM